MPSLEELTEEQRTHLARIANRVLNNKDTSRDFKRLVMKAIPDVRFPEIEQESVVSEQLRERDKRIEELEAKQLESEAERRRQEKRRAASERGLDPDEVENLIVERGKAGRVIDYESAMDLLDLQNQAAAATPADDTWKADDAMPGIKEMLASDNPQGLARKMAHQVIDELRGRRGARVQRQ